MRKIATLPNGDIVQKSFKTSQSNAVALLCEQRAEPLEGDEKRYRNIVGMLNAPFVALLDQVFADDEFWHSFLTGPSSLHGHHAVIGGNLRHSIEVAETAARMAYGSMDLTDSDVLVAGALLHDVGKATEYQIRKKPGWEMTDEGRMLGHKVTGSTLVRSIRVGIALPLRQSGS